MSSLVGSGTAALAAPSSTDGWRWAAPVWTWGAVALCAAAPLGAAAQAGVLLVGVALTGAPHGVLDIDLAAWAGPAGRRRGWMAAFLGLYVCLIIMGLAAWRVAPAATLGAFLLAAAAHFGADAADDGGAVRWRRLACGAAQGLTVVAAPVLLHPAAVSPIFAALADAPAAQVTRVMAALAPALWTVWLATLAAAALALAARERLAPAAELAGLVALFAAAPPLLAFAAYFCGVHAVRHVATMARMSGARGARAQAGWAARRLAPAALATAAGLALLVRFDGGGSVAWTFRILAALTLPHLVLTPVLEWRVAAARRQPPRTRAA